jgi:hypothetical protein
MLDFLNELLGSANGPGVCYNTAKTAVNDAFGTNFNEEQVFNLWYFGEPNPIYPIL